MQQSEYLFLPPPPSPFRHVWLFQWFQITEVCLHGQDEKSFSSLGRCYMFWVLEAENWSLIIMYVLVLVEKMTWVNICYKFGFPPRLLGLVNQSQACCRKVAQQRERHRPPGENNTAIVSCTFKRSFTRIHRYVIDFSSCKNTFLY
jgi:hypothetical protein